jgi:hypothetical protein
MKTKWGRTLVWVVVVGMAGEGWAQISPAEDTPEKPTTSQVDAVNALALRAELHRAVADLIEARAASPTEPARVQELLAKVQQLRAKLAATAPSIGPRGPLTGGRGWFSTGPGMGRGMAYGRGMGHGRGPAISVGPGYGRGPACLWGPGFAQGMRGGYGPGPGWGFVDENRNGICDSYERIWGQP